MKAEMAKALRKAQDEMPAVKPDAVNPHFNNKFVSLGHLIASVRPVLNRNGISFSQFPASNEQGPTLVTILTHDTGESIEYEAPLLLPKNDPQGQGSAITYMRRYALAAALGISDQEDDDGNAGSKPTGAQGASRSSWAMSEPQAKLFKRLLKEKGLKGQDLLLVEEWGTTVLQGGKAGSASDAIDGLMNEPELTVPRLLAAAQKWSAAQDAPDDFDLPPADERDEGTEIAA